MATNGEWINQVFMFTDNGPGIWDVDNVSIVRDGPCPTICGAEGVKFTEQCDFGTGEDIRCPGRCVAPGEVGPNGEEECHCIVVPPTPPLPDPIGPDVVACGGGDNYGLPCQTCDNGPRVGLTCLDSDDCVIGNCLPNNSLCPGGTCGGVIAGLGMTFPYPKSRFIGFTAPSDTTWTGWEVAVRVTLENIEPDATCNGEIRYAGVPEQVCEGGACNTVFWASKLQSTPHFMDWTIVGTVQIYGEEIVSDSRYIIQAVDIYFADELTNEDNFSTPGLIVDTAKWGDVVIPLSGFTSAAQPAISDVLKLVDKWLGNLEPRKSRSQLQPAVINPASSVGIADVLKGVDAWLGTPYPFSITTCTP